MCIFSKPQQPQMPAMPTQPKLTVPPPPAPAPEMKAPVLERPRDDSGVNAKRKGTRQFRVDLTVPLGGGAVGSGINV